MKSRLLLIICLFNILGAWGQNAVEYFSVGNPIKYCGTEFSLAWSAHQDDVYYMQEYLPEGETLAHYNQMFTVSVTFANIDPEFAVAAKIDEIKERKKYDSCANYFAAEHPNGERILEFLVSSEHAGLLDLVELDIHHYKKMKINGKQALVLCFYSRRAYGDDILPFIASIRDKRNYWYEGISDLKIRPQFIKK